MPTASGSNKNNSIWAYVRHIIYFTFDGRKSEAARDYDHKDSWCSENCDNANSALNLDWIAILRFGSQQPSTKQVAKKSQHMRQAILLSKCGHPHPVKTTLNYQRTAVTAGNRVMSQMTTARRLILKGFDKIQVNGRRPMISSIDKRDRKQTDQYAPSAPSAKFSVGPGTKSTSKIKINDAECHEQILFETGRRDGLQDNHATSLDTLGLNWKTTSATHFLGTLEASQHFYIQQKRPNQAGFVTMGNCAISRRPQMATIRWLTWKGIYEIQVNDLCPILSSIDKRDRKKTY